MIRRCQHCRESGMIWTRLTHPWADDGMLHTVLCKVCKGWRRVQLVGKEWKPFYGPKIDLGRCSSLTGA